MVKKLVKYDVIIVGAGAAGCLAAISSLDQNSKILLLDCKSFEEIGNKVCGDAMSADHFGAVNLTPPKNIIRNKVDAVTVFSPSGKYSYNVEGRGYALDRYGFGRWLLNLALDKGAILKHYTKNNDY